MRRIAVPAVLTGILLSLGPVAGSAQQPGGTVVVVTGMQATMPIPTLMEGPQQHAGNHDVADQLFLRLAIPGPNGRTAGDAGFIPQLARSWSRPDSLTLVFHLDPRARWQDGAPVTAEDVVFTAGRATSDSVAPSLASHLRFVESVTAPDPRTVVVRFTRAYSEQLFDFATFVVPLPAHLLQRLPRDSIARSAFVQAPVGDGPYRWVRSVPGQFVELAANPRFFLGAPGIARLVFRTATDPDARINLILSGEADALANVIPPLTNRERIAALPGYRLLTLASPALGYLAFNQRDPADRDRPHAILGDVRVRRALVLALDRKAMVESVFGPYAEVPFGPASEVLRAAGLALPAAAPDTARARALLAEAGWRDHDGDGILDRDGTPLRLAVILPGTSGLRRQMALLAQEQLRRVGVQLDVVTLDGPVWFERYVKGQFDLSFVTSLQDPTPSALTQSWSCTGGTNFARYCDPAVDSLMQRESLAPGDPTPIWREVLTRIEADAPAAFLFAPLDVMAVSRRYDGVELRPGSPWLLVRRWKVRPGAALPRDRVPR